MLLSIVLAAVIGAGLHPSSSPSSSSTGRASARVVRAETLVQSRPTTSPPRATVGLPRPAILRRDPAQHRCPLIVTLLTVEMGIAVIVEAILVLRRPVGLDRHADLGRHDRRGPAGDLPGWWLLALPIGCIVVTVLGFNLLGDGLRAALDPVQRR